jgi:hypothetical protein
MQETKEEVVTEKKLTHDSAKNVPKEKSSRKNIHNQKDEISKSKDNEISEKPTLRGALSNANTAKNLNLKNK